MRITLVRELEPMLPITIHSKGKGRFPDKSKKYIVVSYPIEMHGVWTCTVAPEDDPTAVETIRLEKYGIETVKSNPLYWIETSQNSKTINDEEKSDGKDS